MISYSKRLIFFILSLVLIDLGITKILGYYYRKAPAGDIKEINYVMRQSTEPVVIMGSSRARHHYVPEIFKDSLKLDTYNAGMNGQGIFYHYCVLSALLKRYTPKLVVLDLTPKDIVVSDDFGLDALTELYPFYGTSKEIDAVLELNGWSNCIKMKSGLYRYNSTIADIFSARFVKYDIQHGYKPLFGNAINELKADSLPAFNVDSLKLTYIHKFITLAKEHNIKVLLTVSPSYRIYAYENSFTTTVKNIAMQHGVHFLNYSSDKMFLDHRSYFKDPSHLNNDGARTLSTYIAQRVKQLKDV